MARKKANAKLTGAHDSNMRVGIVPLIINGSTVDGL